MLWIWLKIPVAIPMARPIETTATRVTPGEDFRIRSAWAASRQVSRIIWPTELLIALSEDSLSSAFPSRSLSSDGPAKRRSRAMGTDPRSAADGRRLPSAGNPLRSSPTAFDHPGPSPPDRRRCRARQSPPQVLRAATASCSAVHPSSVSTLPSAPAPTQLPRAAFRGNY